MIRNGTDVQITPLPASGDAWSVPSVSLCGVDVCGMLDVGCEKLLHTRAEPLCVDLRWSSAPHQLRSMSSDPGELHSLRNLHKDVFLTVFRAKLFTPASSSVHLLSICSTTTFETAEQLNRRQSKYFCKPFHRVDITRERVSISSTLNALRWLWILWWLSTSMATISVVLLTVPIRWTFPALEAIPTFSEKPLGLSSGASVPFIAPRAPRS